MASKNKMYQRYGLRLPVAMLFSTMCRLFLSLLPPPLVMVPMLLILFFVVAAFDESTSYSYDDTGDDTSGTVSSKKPSVVWLCFSPLGLFSVVGEEFLGVTYMAIVFTFVTIRITLKTTCIVLRTCMLFTFAFLFCSLSSLGETNEKKI